MMLISNERSFKMSIRHYLVVIALFGSLLIMNSCSKAPNIISANENIAQINPNSFRQVEPSVVSGGQPTKEELKALKEAGIKTVVNLRPRDEIDWNEEETVLQLDLNYIHLPISGSKDITAENASRLTKAIEKNSSEPLYVHCGSGNRVGALIAISEYHKNGSDIEAAISEGKRWGLKSLETQVRSILATD